eukprot:TRINITY_DN137_c0_g1_i1.p1 TRINITY_DN137_c0_g1~~TRINITY_DN137_c0_g1_i1.p1  ORF type:complete len:323 (-),score=81.14 TRINITY_DN137_c0_g1_i1:176-1144(-)
MADLTAIIVSVSGIILLGMAVFNIALIVLECKARRKDEKFNTMARALYLNVIFLVGVWLLIVSLRFMHTVDGRIGVTFLVLFASFDGCLYLLTFSHVFLGWVGVLTKAMKGERAGFLRLRSIIFWYLTITSVGVAIAATAMGNMTYIRGDLKEFSVPFRIIAAYYVIHSFPLAIALLICGIKFRAMYKDQEFLSHRMHNTFRRLLLLNILTVSGLVIFAIAFIIYLVDSTFTRAVTSLPMGLLMFIAAVLNPIAILWYFNPWSGRLRTTTIKSSDIESTSPPTSGGQVVVTVETANTSCDALDSGGASDMKSVDMGERASSV